MSDNTGIIEVSDLVADADDVAEAGEAIFTEKVLDLADVLIIVGRQDPLDPKWNGPQRELIMKANVALEGFVTVEQEKLVPTSEVPATPQMQGPLA